MHTSLILIISICSVPNSLRPLAPPVQPGLLAASVLKLSVPFGMPVGVRYASSKMSASSADLRTEPADQTLRATSLQVRRRDSHQSIQHAHAAKHALAGSCKS